MTRNETKRNERHRPNMELEDLETMFPHEASSNIRTTSITSSGSTSGSNTGNDSFATDDGSNHDDGSSSSGASGGGGSNDHHHSDEILVVPTGSGSYPSILHRRYHPMILSTQNLTRTLRYKRRRQQQQHNPSLPIRHTRTSNELKKDN